MRKRRNDLVMVMVITDTTLTKGTHRGAPAPSRSPMAYRRSPNDLTCAPSHSLVATSALSTYPLMSYGWWYGTFSLILVVPISSCWCTISLTQL
jgi:hypothetical protein